MPFRPKPNNTVSLDGIQYHFTEHPAAPGMAYGQTGRRATVYQVQAQDGSLHALKVFTKAWRDQRNAISATRLRSFARLPGLQVCERTVFTPGDYSELIEANPDLEYAVLMAWVSGETWQEVQLNGRPLTAERSKELGLAFLGILERMEQEGLAHCDLSGPNVLLGFSPVHAALVDVEDIYGPGLVRPQKVGGGSSGYAHKTAPGGVWDARADCFAGAVLLAEMLGWCDERVRRIGYGEQYFDPGEVQQSSERYQVLLSVLREQWGGGVADAFARAWYSETLEDCPSFGEWARLLRPPEPVLLQPSLEDQAREKVEVAELLMGEEHLDEAILILEATNQLAPEVSAGTYARALLTRGTARERANDRDGALNDYRRALQVAPEGGLRDELGLIVAEMEPRVVLEEVSSMEAERVTEEEMAVALEYGAETEVAAVVELAPSEVKPVMDGEQTVRVVDESTLEIIQAPETIKLPPDEAVASKIIKLHPKRPGSVTFTAVMCILTGVDILGIVSGIAMLKRKDWGRLLGVIHALIGMITSASIIVIAGITGVYEAYNYYNYYPYSWEFAGYRRDLLPFYTSEVFTIALIIFILFGFLWISMFQDKLIGWLKPEQIQTRHPLLGLKIIGILYLLASVSLVTIPAGIGLLRCKKWGWWIAEIEAWFFAILGVVLFGVGYDNLDMNMTIPSGPVVVVFAWIALYLLRKDVRSIFTKIR